MRFSQMAVFSVYSIEIEMCGPISLIRELLYPYHVYAAWTVEFFQSYQPSGVMETLGLHLPVDSGCHVHFGQRL